MKLPIRAAHRGLSLLTFLFFFLALVPGSPVAACSICRCGDPTFNALGTDVYTRGAFRVALDWERFEKEQGILEEEPAAFTKQEGDDSAGAGRESVVENRFTTAFSYTFGERVVGVARIPWSSRRLSEEGEEATSRDLSDPEVYALARLWSSRFAPGLGRRAWISALGGVKTDWGKDDLERDGARLDEHLQPGTGSTDVFGGLSGLFLFDAKSSLFGSVQRRWTGSNDFDYEYGDVTLANLGFERKLGRTVDAAAELNFRSASRDRVDESGFLDPNTGGSILYFTPRVILDLGKGLVGRLAVQVPVYRSLNGDQTERTVANVGLTYLF